MSNPLNAEQIAQYHRDGAVLLKGALTAEELQLLEAGLEESYTNPGKRFARIRSPEGDGESFLETFPSQTSPSLQRLLALGRIPEMAARVMGAPSAQLILDQSFYKTKGTINPTPWHQDTPFLRVRGDDMVRVWLTCDFSPRAVTVQMVRGSHRWNVVFSPHTAEEYATRVSDDGKMFNLRSDEDSRPQCPDVARYRDSFDILSWDVAPGDVLLFNGNMIHGADGLPDSPSPRRAFTSMWGGPTLRYIRPLDNALPTLADVRGVQVPDNAAIGDYPNAFPVGWAEPGSPFALG